MHHDSRCHQFRCPSGSRPEGTPRPFSFVTDGKSDNLIGFIVKQQDRNLKFVGLLQVPMDYQCRTYQTNPIPARGGESDMKRERDGRNSHGG